MADDRRYNPRIQDSPLIIIVAAIIAIIMVGAVVVELIGRLI
jgi:hypothetical protein